MKKAVSSISFSVVMVSWRIFLTSSIGFPGGTSKARSQKDVDGADLGASFWNDTRVGVNLVDADVELSDGDSGNTVDCDDERRELLLRVDEREVDIFLC